MREGLRIWVNYTNDWKNRPREEQSIHWKKAKPQPVAKIIETIEKTRTTKTKNDGSVEFNPKKQNLLPKPDDKKPSTKRIVFTKTNEEIKKVSLYLFDNEIEEPSTVGSECFDQILKKS